MDRLFILIASHFVGDFGFQSAWMAEFKAKHMFAVNKDGSIVMVNGAAVIITRWYEVLSYHVFVYVSTMILFMRLLGYHPTPQGIAADAMTHFVIDRLKGRDLFGIRVIGSVWLDQMCHLTVRVVLWRLGWL